MVKHFARVRRAVIAFGVALGATTLLMAQVTPVPSRNNLTSPVVVGNLTMSSTGCISWTDVFLQRSAAGSVGVSATCGGASSAQIAVGTVTFSGGQSLVGTTADVTTLARSTNNQRFVLGLVSALYPALNRSTTGISMSLGDGTAGGFFTAPILNATTHLDTPAWIPAGGTAAVTGLITSTGGITGGASSHTTGTFSSTLGVTGLITSSGGITGGAASHTSGAFSTTLAVTGAATFSADSSIAATKKFYLDGGSDTYIYEAAANAVLAVAGGAESLRWDTTRVYARLDLIIDPGKRFYLDGGGDTYITEGSANNIEVHAGSTQYFFANTLVELPTAYTSTSGAAANVVVISGGQLLRSTSSLRYKDDVQPFSGGLTELLKLQPVSFVSKNETNGPRYIGFTAEALDAAGFYNVVNYDDQGRPDAIQYDRLTTYLINAVKELSAEVDALKAAQGKAVTHPNAAVDAASRTKAIAKEQAAKAKRDAERLAECKANNVELKKQGKPEVVCKDGGQ